MLEEVLAYVRKTRWPVAMRNVLVAVSVASAEAGDFERAEALALEALDIIPRSTYGLRTRVFCVLAAAGDHQGDVVRAAALLGVVDRLLSQPLGSSALPPLEHVRLVEIRGRLTERLGDEAFEEARDRGARLTDEDAYALARWPLESP